MIDKTYNDKQSYFRVTRSTETTEEDLFLKQEVVKSTQYQKIMIKQQFVIINVVMG